MPWELTKNQNSPCSEVSSSLTVCNNKLFPDQDCDVWQKVAFIWQLVTTSSVTGTIKSSKAIPKAKLASKKVMVTVWWSAARLILDSFLNSRETITSESMLSKLMRCTENCNACSQHQSTGRAQFSMTISNRTSHNQPFRSWTNHATKFCLIGHIHRTSHQTNYHFLKHLNNFLHGKCFHNQQDPENAFQEFIETRSMDFYVTGINKLISH